jgi:hypothetical protein
MMAFGIHASDPDQGDVVSYWSKNLPMGATFFSANGSFLWTPDYEQAGIYSGLIFGATDSKDSTSDTISITVVNVNRTPWPFALTSPHDGDTVKAKTANVYWAHSTDPDAADTVKYRLLYSVDDASSWQHTVNSISDTQYTFSALEELKTYSWKVVAYDSANASTECSNGSFSFLVADLTPPEFTISILPNPVLPSEFDIFGYPSESLKTAPLAKVITSAGTTDHEMTLLANRELTAYVMDYKIGQPGQYTISVCGNDLWSNEGCTDEHIAVSPVFVDNTTTLTSPSGSFQVTVPPGAVSSNAMMICSESGSDAGSGTDGNLPPGLVPLRALNLKSSLGTFKKPAVISADPCMLLGQSDTECRVAVFRQTPEGLEPVSTRYDLTSKILNVEIQETGTYLFCQATGSDQLGRGTLPMSSELEQNSPNPFNNETRIAFSAIERCHARVEVFNTLGRLVATVLDADVTPGNYSVSWNGNDRFGNECSSGIYLYRLTAGTFTSTKRMLFLK